MGNVRSRNRAIVLFIRVNGVGNAMAAVVAQRGAKGASAGILMGRVMAVAGGRQSAGGVRAVRHPSKMATGHRGARDLEIYRIPNKGYAGK